MWRTARSRSSLLTAVSTRWSRSSSARIESSARLRSRSANARGHSVSRSTMPPTTSVATGAIDADRADSDRAVPGRSATQVAATSRRKRRGRRRVGTNGGFNATLTAGEVTLKASTATSLAQCDIRHPRPRTTSAASLAAVGAAVAVRPGTGTRAGAGARTVWGPARAPAANPQTPKTPPPARCRTAVTSSATTTGVAWRTSDDVLILTASVVGECADASSRTPGTRGSSSKGVGVGCIGSALSPAPVAEERHRVAGGPGTGRQPGRDTTRAPTLQLVEVELPLNHQSDPVRPVRGSLEHQEAASPGKAQRSIVKHAEVLGKGCLLDRELRPVLRGQAHRGGPVRRHRTRERSVRLHRPGDVQVGEPPVLHAVADRR